MSDLTDTLRLIALGAGERMEADILNIARAGAGQKQLVLDHYRTVLLEAQRDADWQELITQDPEYRLWRDSLETNKD